MQTQVHPRVTAKRPEITEQDVLAVVVHPLRSRARDTDPVQWIGAGIDPNGRLLEFIATETDDHTLLVFHAMPATKKTLRELGLGGGS